MFYNLQYYKSLYIIILKSYLLHQVYYYLMFGNLTLLLFENAIKVMFWSKVEFTVFNVFLPFCFYLNSLNKIFFNVIYMRPSQIRCLLKLNVKYIFDCKTYTQFIVFSCFHQ